MKNDAATRVAIAEDALALLLDKKIVADTSCYYESYFGEVCRVCAIGALTVAVARRSEQDDPGNSSTRGCCLEFLNPYFDDEQLALIEGCFEGNDHYLEEIHDDGEAYAAWLRFQTDTPDDEWSTPGSRLESILYNIIDNGGEFKP